MSSLRPDADVDRARQLSRAAATGALADHLLQRLLDHASLDVRQVQAAEHHLDDRVAPHQSVPQLLCGLETNVERGVIQQALEKMVRKRAGGSGAAKLTSPINIGVGTK